MEISIDADAEGRTTDPEKPVEEVDTVAEVVQPQHLEKQEAEDFAVPDLDTFNEVRVDANYERKKRTDDDALQVNRYSYLSLIGRYFNLRLLNL